MSTIYMIMGYGGLALAILCLGAAIVLFIRWDIPKVIGEMTGRTQRRAIAKIQKERNQDMLLHEAEMAESLSNEMQGMDRNLAALHAAVSDEDVTDVLTSHLSAGRSGNDSQGQGILDEEVTSVLHATSSEETTTVLHRAEDIGESETTVLGSGNNREIITIPDETIQESGVVLQILELIVIHTDDRVA